MKPKSTSQLHGLSTNTPSTSLTSRQDRYQLSKLRVVKRTLASGLRAALASTASPLDGVDATTMNSRPRRRGPQLGQRLREEIDGKIQSRGVAALLHLF